MIEKKEGETYITVELTPRQMLALELMEWAEKHDFSLARGLDENDWSAYIWHGGRGPLRPEFIGSGTSIVEAMSAVREQVEAKKVAASAQVAAPAERDAIAANSARFQKAVAQLLRAMRDLKAMEMLLTEYECGDLEAPEGMRAG